MAVMSMTLVPAQAEPTIADVKTQVDTLYHQAEAAQERVNDHKLRLKELKSDLTSLQSDEQREETNLESVRSQVRQQVVDQYQGQTISTVGQVVTSEDPAAFLDQLSTLSSVNSIQAGVYATYDDASAAYKLRRKATNERAADIGKTTQALEAEKATIDTKLAEAKKVLDKLEKKEREKLFASASSADAAAADSALSAMDGKTSGRAQAAIKFAMSQLGDSYVFGAAGPNSWDCSGLMMVAWAQAGVGLPHSSRMQAGMGTPVSTSALQPGDLVFYYSPVSHVGMYIGNGQIVHAANPRAGVKVSPVNEMPITGARRVG